MNHRRRMAAHAGTVAVFAIVAAIVVSQTKLTAGPGSPGGSAPKACKDEDIPTAVAMAWLCGNPFDSATGSPTQCACLAIDTDDSTREGSNLPLNFEWNLGQADAQHGFVAHTAGGLAVYLSANEAVIERKGKGGRANGRIRARLQGAKGGMQGEPMDELGGRVNYLIGSDPKKWVTDVPTYRRVKYRGVYPGVDVVYYGNGRNLEHDFEVAPGANPDQVRFSFEGAEGSAVNADGDLVLKTSEGDLIWKKPHVYQVAECGAQIKIEARYRQQADGSHGFELGAYDPKRALVIDPEVLFTSYLGRARTDIGTRVTTDAGGNIYVTGGTVDEQFPVTPDAFKTPSGASDRNNVMIAKFKPDGTGLVYATYVGGQSSDVGLAVGVDGAGNVYASGLTFSLNFPTTNGALRRTPGSSDPNEFENGDCFLFKLSAAGNGLQYSTYLGGQRPDFCSALVVDRAGAVTIAGATASPDFPTTEDAFQRQLRLGLNKYSFDGFVTKVNAAGSGLIYSTLFGGNATDIPTSLALDADGNAYVAGITNSTIGFPVSTGAFQRAYKQEGPLYRGTIHDTFVVKIEAGGKSVLYGTYVGGAGNDLAFGVSVDGQGNAYVCGSTESTDFPVTPQAFQGRFQGGGALAAGIKSAGDGFAYKVNPTGTALVYATYLGGSSEERVFGCAVDGTGVLHLTGYTLSRNFPVTTDAQQRTFGGTSSRETPVGDAFYTKLDRSGQALVYSTYFGGVGDEAGLGIVVDANGTAYISGGTSSVGLPNSQIGAQRVYGGGVAAESFTPFGDAFVVKWGDPPPRVTITVSSIVNGASQIGGAIAPGEFVTIRGSGFGEANIATEPAPGGRFPLRLGQTRVLFDGIEAPLVVLAPGSVSAYVPFGVGAADPKQTRLVVEVQGNGSTPLPVPLAASAPGLFTGQQWFDGNGRGQALVLNEDGSGNSAENPAAPGSIVTLYGTGGGVTDPPSNDGEVATEDFPPLALPSAIQVGDVAVTELYFSGGAKGRPAGVFQMQFRLPAELSAGDQPLTVTVGEVASQSGVTIAIGAPAAAIGAPAAEGTAFRRKR